MELMRIQKRMRYVCGFVRALSHRDYSCEEEALNGGGDKKQDDGCSARRTITNHNRNRRFMHVERVRDNWRVRHLCEGYDDVSATRCDSGFFFRSSDGWTDGEAASSREKIVTNSFLKTFQ